MTPAINNESMSVNSESVTSPPSVDSGVLNADMDLATSTVNNDHRTSVSTPNGDHMTSELTADNDHMTSESTADSDHVTSGLTSGGEKAGLLQTLKGVSLMFIMFWSSLLSVCLFHAVLYPLLLFPQTHRLYRRAVDALVYSWIMFDTVTTNELLL